MSGAINSARYNRWYVRYFRITIAVTSVLAVFFIVMREKVRHQWLNKQRLSLNEQQANQITAHHN